MTTTPPLPTPPPAGPRMPAIYLGHGAPPLLDDALWVSQLRSWAGALPRPAGILIVSAHWEHAPITLSAPAAATPLVYDFWGFEPRFYQMTYPTPDASALAARVAAVMPDGETVLGSARGLDHGAWVPLKVMYPAADVPVLQMSLPGHEPARLVQVGTRLRPLRDEGILIIGSGFLTHGLRYLTDWSPDATPPGWSAEFDLWAADALARGDLDSLANFRRAPGMPYAHPTVEHFTPLFVTLGAATNPEEPPATIIDGFFLGLAKRSIQAD
jgi:4,5-DOPA dioxygenase extradiol